ncbi:MAG: zinc ribbon domain-containing protein [Armatimonadota bacterium]|nr:zinc ribbon domain-containing protein [Armatimonadota bacterium]
MQFEKLCSIGSLTGNISCPACGALDVQRLISTFYSHSSSSTSGSGSSSCTGCRRSSCAGCK